MLRPMFVVDANVGARREFFGTRFGFGVRSGEDTVPPDTAPTTPRAATRATVFGLHLLVGGLLVLVL